MNTIHLRSAPSQDRLGRALPSALLAACRSRQWTKNLLVFAGPLFSFRLDPYVWSGAFVAFVAFCAISSSIYLFNDLLDVDCDRAHPIKCRRPIASGEVSVKLARFLAVCLASLSLLLASAVGPGLFGVILGYGQIQLGYCLRFKRMPLLDLFSIASGFLLRAIAGVVSAGLPFSPWFLLTVGLLALFLAVEKRKAELQLCRQQGTYTRFVLERYSLPLLLRLESLVSTSAFMSYALWAAGPALRGAQTSWMLLTVPFVLAGIFRYQLLSDPEESARRIACKVPGGSEQPEEILLHDRGIRVTVIAWVLTVAIIGAVHYVIGPAV